MQLPIHSNPTKPTKTTGRKKDHKNRSFDVWARAPYNFVPLPEMVIPSSIVPLDTFKGNTGWVKCELVTKTPMYVRGMMLSEDFRNYSEHVFYQLPQDAKERRASFFTQGDNYPRLPGSTLRGMLRAIIEIITYSKVQPVSEEPIVYRAVADGENTALGRHYKAQIDQSRVRAGYMEKSGSDWYIRPAKPIEGWPFGVIRVAEGEQPRGETLSSLRQRLSGSRWKECRNAYEVNAAGGKIRKFGYEFSAIEPGNQYVLVITDKTPGLRVSKKHPEKGTGKNQYIFGKPDLEAQPIEVPYDLVNRYREQLSEAQEELLGPGGVLRENQPVFYLTDGSGKLIFFGHARCFRLPYLKSPADLLPYDHCDNGRIDMAEAMFGFVRSSKVQQRQLSAYAGRIQVEDGICSLTMRDASLPLEHNCNPKFPWFTPRILSSPKPTTFQHYLVQDAERGHEPDCPQDLAFYDTPSPQETVIRGSKLYWSKGEILADSDWQFRNGESKKKGCEDLLDQFRKQLTGLIPIRPGVSFTFYLHFQNLRDEELGALLWALELPPGCCHKLGMGKPLGLGSVQLSIKEFCVSKRESRYQRLFENDHWALDEEKVSLDEEKTSVDHFKNKFERYITRSIIGREDKLTVLPRIQTLLKLLEFPGPDPNWTRYMEIERSEEYDGFVVNEYSRRPVLPDPHHIIGGDPSRHPKPCSDSQTSKEADLQLLSTPTDVTESASLSNPQKIVSVERAKRKAVKDTSVSKLSSINDLSPGLYVEAVIFEVAGDLYKCDIGLGRKFYGQLRKKNATRSLKIGERVVVKIKSVPLTKHAELTMKSVNR